MENSSKELLLHQASSIGNLNSVQLRFDAYPEAIFTTCLDRFSGEDITPLDLARVVDTAERRQNLTSFETVVRLLEAQLTYALIAQDVRSRTILDTNEWLPLHHTLENSATLGAIKLLTHGNAYVSLEYI